MKPKKPKVLINIKKQSGKIPNLPRDLARTAMYPGKRMSKKGNIYWETRKNRSDQNKKRRI